MAKAKEPAQPQPQVLSTEQIQRALFEGLADRRMREFYESDAGTDYLLARLNMRAMDQKIAASQNPAA